MTTYNNYFLREVAGYSNTSDISDIKSYKYNLKKSKKQHKAEIKALVEEFRASDYGMYSYDFKHTEDIKDILSFTPCNTKNTSLALAKTLLVPTSRRELREMHHPLVPKDFYALTYKESSLKLAS